MLPISAIRNHSDRPATQWLCSRFLGMYRMMLMPQLLVRRSNRIASNGMAISAVHPSACTAPADCQLASHLMSRVRPLSAHRSSCWVPNEFTMNT